MTGALVKPINYLFMQSIHESAYKLTTFFMAALVGVGIRLFFPQYLALPTSPLVIFYFIISFIFSYFLSQCLQLVIGLSTIWIGEISALNQTRRTIEAIFTGELAPLSFFPLFLQKIASFLPFPFFTYIPAQIFLGKISTSSTPRYLGIELVWLIFFALGVHFIWKRALRRYDGIGI
jgi:ABC-2 type transport system permease protein